MNKQDLQTIIAVLIKQLEAQGFPAVVTAVELAAGAPGIISTHDVKDDVYILTVV